MKNLALIVALAGLLTACSGSDPGSSSSSSSSTGSSSSSSSSTGTSGTDVSSASSSTGTSGSGSSAGSSGSSGSAGGGCTAARAQLLGSVDAVSSGAVTALGDTSGVTTLYVDASAGGISGTGNNPWTFIDLGAGAKAQVTDVTSITSTAWDLALKRAVLYTNGGSGGPGQGGAALIAKDFDAVTAADATGVTFGTERFFDDQCNPRTDATGSVATTFSVPTDEAQYVYGWYTYDLSTNGLAPTPGTWLVRGAAGALYKLAIQTYYAEPDGSVGTGDGGTYAIKVKAL